MQSPQTPPPTAAPVQPQGPKSHLQDLISRFSPRQPATANEGPANSHLAGLATTALPLVAMAARRVPIGLALLGAAVAAVALADPVRRGKVMDAGRRGLAALRR